MKHKLLFCLFTFFCSGARVFAQQYCESAKITDIFGNENPVIDCSYPLDGTCLQMKVDYPSFFKTDSYAVTSENFETYGAFNEGTPINADADDLFLKKIALPFQFCFFGQNFTEIVLGSNGMVTFDVAQLGKINYPNVERTNPSNILPSNSIFGVYEDLIFSKNNDSEIFYRITGSAPCRKLVINYYKARILGCDQTLSFQIALSEGTNTVEIFVESKPIPCSGAKFRNSLLGIMNLGGTLGYSPADRNTSVWEAQNEAWKFSPSGAEITPQISWFDSANQMVGNGELVRVCPEKNERYTAKIKYPMCGNFELELVVSSDLTFAPDYPLAKNYTEIFCSDATQINLNAFTTSLTPQNAALFNFSFHNTKEEAENNENPQPKSFVLTENKTFYVRIQNPSDPACFRTAVLNLNVLSKSLLTHELEICDFENDGIEADYELSNFNTKLFASPINGSIHYFLSSTDAANDANEIFQMNLIDGKELYVNYKTNFCQQTFGPIKIKLLSGPLVNSPIDFPFTTCDLKNDLKEEFKFLEILGPLVTSDPDVTIKFFLTYEEAFSGVGSQLITIHEGIYSIYVRVESASGCFNIAVVNLDITFNEVWANPKQVYLCFDGVQDIAVNLDDHAPDMLVDSPIGIITTYFLTEEDAEFDLNPLSNFQIISEDGDFVSKTFFVKFTDKNGCYALKPLTYNLVHPVIKQSAFDLCDFANDGVENVQLSIYSKNIVGNQVASVKYFKSFEDAQNNSGSMINFMVQSAVKLFVRIESFGCSNVYEINIKLVDSPIIKEEVSKIFNAVCDNNNDGHENVDLTQFESEISPGSNTFIFQYYLNYDPETRIFTGLINAPAVFSVSGNTVVFVKVSNVAGCFSVSKLKIEFNFLPTIILKSALLQRCDYDFNLNESFTLEEATPQLYDKTTNSIPLSDLEIFYYETESAANAGVASTRIKSPFVSTDSRITVWARFTAKTTNCYTVAPIKLETYVPPKALNSVIKDLCDDNLDGSYDVNLMNYTASMVYTQSSLNQFIFYLSKSDAETNSNPIADPQNFSANPFPSQIWVRVQNIPGCFDTASVNFTFGQKVKLNGSGNFTVTNTCDIGNNGIEEVDLTQFEKTIYSGTAIFEYYPSLSDLQNSTNKILTPKNFLYKVNSGPQKFFVKVVAAGFCPEKIEIVVKLKKTPQFSLPDYYFCPTKKVDIKPDFAELDIISYEWMSAAGTVLSTTNQLLNVDKIGIYKINVTAANGCSFSTNFEVKEYEVPIITNLIANGNSYTVIATGSSAILYSVDGINFQPGNVFYNLPYGIINFYVKFENSDCLGIPKEGLILNIKNVFTPNSDGVNDTWIIDDFHVFQGKKANLKVFSKYKNMIFEQDSATRLEWNGKTSSRLVPTDSYWYVLTLADGRIFTGWVVVKNRN